MNVEFINELRATLKRDRQSAIRFRHDAWLRKHCIQQALLKRAIIREFKATC
ncbi:hypothetical protein Ppb6_01226 [Photorhabdus australis subsp. thailandensis]|uniref:Uncharacterized protein n=1 Tax=Photorhabdus australis subsp. thailandensis TaxID=2805096 RepID=A0A1C0U6N3_9GAMM|nr:hypothetical protein [Photorhabdus australis]OCQ53600.1 hypothetical protein Ppb6_01226 [Photorhabdus australis subsp. thailandensis]